MSELLEERAPSEWLEAQFEFERCYECCGDTANHIEVEGPFGQSFAYCLSALTEWATEEEAIRELEAQGR